MWMETEEMNESFQYHPAPRAESFTAHCSSSKGTFHALPTNCGSPA